MQSLFWRTGVLAVMAAGLLQAASISALGDETTDKKDAEYYELMRVFVDTFEQVDRNYVKDIDSKKRRQLVEAAIRGMVRELDQYSNYISPEELTQFTQSVEQEFGGIGIQVQVDPKTNRLLVISPLPGTPAYRAGMRAGDLIMEIKGQSTEGMSINDAVKLLKGKPGDKVQLGILHAGETEVEQMQVERAIIQVATVLGDHYKQDDKWDFMLDNEKKIGYVRLTHFSRRTDAELREAMKELKERGLKGLILDLRNNPGGLLSQATSIADMFVDDSTLDGLIVSTKGRNSPERSFRARKPGTYSDFPMAVLVNRYSASASEIVSACLQDHGRAIVVGERTWGKGSVQNIIDLDAGKSALKLTTASYHRPSGKDIHRDPGETEDDEWGVMPNEDHRLRFTNDEFRAYMEYRRKRDILGGKPDSEAEQAFSDKQLNDALAYITFKLSGGEAPKAEAGEKSATPPAPPKPKEGAFLPLRLLPAFLKIHTC